MKNKTNTFLWFCWANPAIMYHDHHSQVGPNLRWWPKTSPNLTSTTSSPHFSSDWTSWDLFKNTAVVFKIVSKLLILRIQEGTFLFFCICRLGLSLICSLAFGQGGCSAAGQRGWQHQAFQQIASLAVTFFPFEYWFFFSARVEYWCLR